VRRLCAFDQPSTMFIQAPASASSTRPSEVKNLLTMDSPNANHAGGRSPNIDLKELYGLDDGFPTDSKDEALPKLVCISSRKFYCTRADYNEQVELGDGNATSTVCQLSNMQIKAKISADEGVTLKSEHRDRFTLFPKLLFDIRTMIRVQICKEPRIVEVEFQAYRNRESPSKSDFGFAPRDPLPALLHVCSETRHQGLKHYTKVLQRPLSADHVPNNII